MYHDSRTRYSEGQFASELLNQKKQLLDLRKTQNHIISFIEIEDHRDLQVDFGDILQFQSKISHLLLIIQNFGHFGNDRFKN